MTRYQQEYFQNNKERFAYYGTKHRDSIKAEMVIAYGGKCLHCEIDDPVVLCLDHVNDDSHIEKTLYGENARGGHKLYLRLKREGWPKERFQLLCFNCNAKKEHARRRLEMEARVFNDVPVDRSKIRAGLAAPKSNRSGVKGVFWNTQKGKWNASIMSDYKNIHVGFFDNLREAALAYNKKAIELWGDEAYINSDEEIEQAIANYGKPILANVSASILGL